MFQSGSSPEIDAGGAIAGLLRAVVVGGVGFPLLRTELSRAARGDVDGGVAVERVRARQAGAVI